MGIYIYTIRAKTVNITLPDGARVAANMYSYAYKCHSMWPGDYGYNGYRLTEENAARNAENVFQAPRSGYVIWGTYKDGLEGDAVYKDVKQGRWHDTDKFPGTLVGWLKKVGKSYVVADRTEWSKGTKSFRDGIWVPIRTRSIMIDDGAGGRVAKYESEDLIESSNETNYQA